MGMMHNVEATIQPTEQTLATKHIIDYLNDHALYVADHSRYHDGKVLEAKWHFRFGGCVVLRRRGTIADWRPAGRENDRGAGTVLPQIAKLFKCEHAAIMHVDPTCATTSHTA